VGVSTACVTGATAGIGAAFVTELAARGYDLVLVARDRDRLETLADHLRDSHKVLVEVLVADLGTDSGCQEVSDRLADSSRPVEILVNNAGFGVNQRFIGGDLAREEEMLNVLVRAVLRLTHAVLPGMVQRGTGSVINVSSVAGWLPMGTYSAAKSWVTVFSESLASELSGTGVSVTAVCPGFTHTEFHARAQMRKDVMPEWMWLDADTVARDGLAAALAGRSVNVPSHRYQAMSLATRYLPRPLVRKAAALAPQTRSRR
jgi:hypothetical protein